MPECRICHCTEHNACVHPLLPSGSCYWERPGICSMCVLLLTALVARGEIDPDEALDLLEGPGRAKVSLVTEGEFTKVIRARAAGV